MWWKRPGRLTGARFGLFLAAGSERATLSFVGLTRDDFASAPAVGRAPVLASVLLSGESLRVDDVAVWAKGEEAARSYGVLADGRLVRSWLAAPVRGRGDSVLGAVYLGHHRAHAFDARHERLVSGLCSQLGGALEHCALFAERSRVANALSESLLPPLLPTIPGLDAAARYRPSGADVDRAGQPGGGRLLRPLRDRRQGASVSCSATSAVSAPRPPPSPEWPATRCGRWLRLRTLPPACSPA